MRTRYWGIYDLRTKQWLSDDCWMTTAQLGNRKRTRYFDIYDAADAISKADYTRMIVPRPFYVVRKAKKLVLTESQLEALNEAVHVLKKESYEYTVCDLKREFGL